MLNIRWKTILAGCILATSFGAPGRAAMLTYLPQPQDARMLLAQVPEEREYSRPAPVQVNASLPPTGADIPEQPFREPIKTFVQLNRRGEDIFRQPGAVPYLVIGAAALATDRQTLKWFHVPKTGEKKSKFSSTFSTVGSGLVIGPSVIALYALGHGREKDTSKLWAAALVNATIWTEALKTLTGKERPETSDNRPVYHGPSLHNDSFPSGHMEAATSSAVILGHQYPKLKLVFYGLAAAVGVARIEHRNHFPSDVYWGAGVGYYGAWQALRNKDAILRWRF